MKLLLDTQIALWVWSQPDRIPASMRAALINPGNEILFSQVSTWEIQVKHGIGKLSLPSRPEVFLPRAIEQSGFIYNTITDAAIYFLDRLPDHHRDPFDRLLIAHALTGGYRLATVDQQILQYPAPTLA